MEERINLDWMERQLHKIATEVAQDKDRILAVTRSHYKYIEKFLGREEEQKAIEKEHLTFAQKLQRHIEDSNDLVKDAATQPNSLVKSLTDAQIKEITADPQQPEAEEQIQVQQFGFVDIPEANESEEQDSI